jgi:hypothetical protein
MNKSIANTFLIFTCCLFAVSCNSTNSSDLTLEDIIPNSTWYYIGQSQNVYAKVVFNNLNTTVDFEDHIPFPCDTDSGISYQTAKYDIIGDSHIYLSRDQTNETVIEVLDYSKTRFTASVSADDIEETIFITFRSSCTDLR